MDTAVMREPKQRTDTVWIEVNPGKSFWFEGREIREGDRVKANKGDALILWNSKLCVLVDGPKPTKGKHG